MRYCAFFDLDRTLLASDTSLLFCNYILKQERIRVLFLLILLPATLLWLLHLLTTVQLRRAFFSFLFRMQSSTLQGYVDDFVKSELKPLYFPELLNCIEKHRRAGALLVLNTGSVNLYVGGIARELGFAVYRSTELQLQDSMPLFPKISHLNKGAAKIESMSTLLAEQVSTEYLAKIRDYKNPPQIKGAYTYTDSYADLPLIHLSEHVTLVQPIHPKLLQMAKQKNWKIIYPQNRISTKKIPFFVLLQLLGLYK